MEHYDLAIPVAELYILKRDCEIVKKFSQSKNPIIMVALIPFVSLFCFEALDYFKKKDAPIAFEQSSRYSIKDVRNKMKFFDVRMNQLLNTIRNVDALQDKQFINYMKYSEIAYWNIHDNIGIYYDQNHHIISNTHYSYYVFQDEKLIKKKLEQSSDLFEDDPRIPPEEMRTYGYDIGFIIGAISESLAVVGDFVTSDIHIESGIIDSKDFNTNRICCGSDIYKIIKIFLLHVLSSINFVLYVLKKCTIRDSGWILRVEYITYHYLLRRLSELEAYIKKESSELNDYNLLELFRELAIEIEGNELINSDFRNCMMHYGLKTEDDRILIKEEYFNLAIPLCGLVESIYNKSYWDFQSLIEDELEKISEVLSCYLDLELRSPNKDIE